MKNVKRALLYISVLTAAEVIGGLIVTLLVLPSMNWSATNKPAALETRIANYTISRWVRRNANNQSNPFPETPENLKPAKAEFGEHCAICHGLDGSGVNRIEADFYPAVPKLTGQIQSWSDGQIYYVIANGIGLSAMPGFSRNHDSQDIWHTVLWIRHLAKLTPDEKAQLENEMKAGSEQHERTMHGNAEN
jgi:mono/diheme cytochrome c family protein